ncbi:HcpE [Helicobacter aurati]|uniref:Beta-lactamase n=2 Tax=Helicobacter aurati TaxID=137778 RepID=A0A3D8J1B2_9HELI|nr:HcpE [Helicobacter aurati]
MGLFLHRRYILLNVVFLSPMVLFANSYNTYNYYGNYNKSYHNNNPQADYDMAYNLYKKGDLEGALPLFGKLCEQNNFIACLSAGIIQGKMLDDLDKNKRYSRSQRKKLKEQYYLSMMAFYQKSCNGGNYDACNNLAFYEYATTSKTKNDTEQKSETKSVELYTKACQAGNKEACQNLGVIYSGVTNDKNGEDTMDLTRAQNYYGKSCTMGDSVACFNLGVLRYNYATVASDYAEAIHLFNQACGGDYPAACLNLGIIYERGVTQDSNEDIANALQYYTKACYLKNANACTYLSKLANKQSKIN